MTPLHDMKKHNHRIYEECTPSCQAHDPAVWTCPRCKRQLPMMADTEDWPEPLCFECFDDTQPNHASPKEK